MASIKNITGGVPTPRAGHSTMIYGNKLYLFGGEDSQGNTNDFFIFDLIKFEWSRINTLGNHPLQRSYHSASFIPANALFEGSYPKLVIFGGYTDNGFENDLHFLDLVTMKWERPIVVGENQNN